jgi:hypothetical protein
VPMKRMRVGSGIPAILFIGTLFYE